MTTPLGVRHWHTNPFIFIGTTLHITVVNHQSLSFTFTIGQPTSIYSDFGLWGVPFVKWAYTRTTMVYWVSCTNRLHFTWLNTLWYPNSLPITIHHDHHRPTYDLLPHFSTVFCNLVLTLYKTVFNIFSNLFLQRTRTLHDLVTLERFGPIHITLEVCEIFTVLDVFGGVPCM